MKLDTLRCEDFEPYVDQVFHIDLDGFDLTAVTVNGFEPGDPPRLALKLVTATTTRKDSIPGRRDHFSLLFQGPPEVVLAQGQYRLEHPELGALELFTVPVQLDDGRLQYQVIFN